MVAASLARNAGLLLVAVVTGGCTLPSTREQQFAQERLEGLPGVERARVSCNDDFSATSELCAEIRMSDGSELLFFGVGYKAFGPNATNVWIGEAGGLSPRAISCGNSLTAAADFHRDGLLGHHFTPGLTDLADALERYREIIEELEYWPRCPQFWELQDKHGVNYRYCANTKTALDQSPSQPDCR